MAGENLPITVIIQKKNGRIQSQSADIKVERVLKMFNQKSSPALVKIERYKFFYRYSSFNPPPNFLDNFSFLICLMGKKYLINGLSRTNFAVYEKLKTANLSWRRKRTERSR